MSITNGWTERRRKQAACNARKHKPWGKSTGPRTEEGKTAVKNNALKHGMRTADMEELCRVLRAQRLFLKLFSGCHSERRNAAEKPPAVSGDFSNAVRLRNDTKIKKTFVSWCLGGKKQEEN